MIRRLALILALMVPFAGVAAAQTNASQPNVSEQVVAGLSQSRIGITANFDGSEIIIYGAVRRDGPPPPGDLDVIVTVQGPSAPVTVRRKARTLGIWVNTQSTRVGLAPSFYAISTTAPLADILSETDNLRHKISIPRAIRSVGMSEGAEDAENFLNALIRIREANGVYMMDEGGVSLSEGTLLRTDFILPPKLSEGVFQVRIFLLRDGSVVDVLETAIDVRKEGVERVIYRLAHDQPLIYGLIALVLAALAGWMASVAFQRFRP